MKRKAFRKLAPALCALALALSLVPAAQAAGEPAKTDNWLKNDYEEYSERSHSCLYANPGGGLTRVEDVPYGDTILIEDYSGDFRLQSSRTLPVELDGLLGFFPGSQYNYLFFGKNNRSENDGAEVFRAVKYSKSWERLEQGCVYGANTSFWNGGPVRCAESGGMLYVHASHTMYRTAFGDGLNHQANMLMAFRTSDMTATEQDCTAAYVSHSLNQYILASRDGDLILANHGDAAPRALVLHKLTGGAGAEKLGQASEVRTPEFIGGSKVPTRTKMGGVAETSSGYVMAFAQKEDGFPNNPYDLHLAYVSKADFTAPMRIAAVTHYRQNDGGATIPMIVPTGLDGGWLLWNQTKWTKDGTVNNGFSYARYSADGSVGEITTLPDIALSDCQPILYNGKAVWYTTNDSAPVFYTLDDSGVTATPAGGSPQTAKPASPAPAPAASGTSFPDVPSGHWAYADIMQCVANGAVTGFTDGTFRPEDAVTIPQFIVMLERAYYPDRLAEYQANPKYAGKPWYVPVFQAARSSILHYLETRLETYDVVQSDWSDFKDAPIDRFTMAAMAANVLEDQTRYISSKDCEPALAAVSDYSGSWPYSAERGVSICLEYGVMTGMPDGSFSGNKTVTRAQACAVINRLYEKIRN